MERPIANSYWIIPAFFLAGEYPGAPKETEARLKLLALLQAGIDTFVDLTHPGESGLLPYASLLPELGLEMTPGKTIRHLRFPVDDMTAPSEEQTRTVLGTIRGQLAEGRHIYLHCWGGRGRTGAIVGCYLREGGKSGEEALEQIRLWRKPTPKGMYPSPETAGQIYRVLNWTLT